MPRMSLVTRIRKAKKLCLPVLAGLVVAFTFLTCEKPIGIDPDNHVYFGLDIENNLVYTQFAPGAETHPAFTTLLTLPANLSEPENFEILSVIPYGKTALLLVTRKHGLLYTRDLGETWERVDDGLPPEKIWPFENHGFTKPVVGCSVSRDKSRIALLFAEELYLSRDAGRSFSRAKLEGGIESIEYLSVAWHPDNDKLLLIGTALPGRRLCNGVYFSADGGESVIGIDDGLPGEPTFAPNYLEEIRAVAWGPDEDTFFAGLGNGGGILLGSVRGKKLRPLAAPELKTYPDGDFYRVDHLDYYNGILFVTTNRPWKKVIPVSVPETGGESNAHLARLFLQAEGLLSATTADGRTLSFARAYTPKRSFSPDQRVYGKRGLYISYSFTQGENYRKLVELLKLLKLNAVIINMKNDSGDILAPAGDPLLKQVGAVGSYVKLKETFARLKQDGIYIIGRVVVFKDGYLYDYDNHKYAIKYQSGGPLKKGPEKWVDPYSEFVWDYNIAAAKAIVEAGVDEIQFDYIRFPDLKGGLSERSRYDFKKENQWMREALLSFLKKARHSLSVPVSIDIFGYQAVYKYGRWIGQDITEMAAQVDAVSPMFYPSHYTGGYAVGYREKRIYYTIKLSCKRAKELIGGAHLRPYIQAFYYKDNEDNYGIDYIGWELDGLKDSGVEDYIYWNNLVEYTILIRGALKYFGEDGRPLTPEIKAMIPEKKPYSSFVSNP